MRLRILPYGVLVAGCVFPLFPSFLTVLTAFKGPGQLSETLPWEPGLPPSIICQPTKTSGSEGSETRLGR